MTKKTDATDQLLEAVVALRSDMARLESRIAQLEQSRPMWRSASPMPAAPATAGGIDQDVVMSIAAAIATHLGVRPRIRQIRLLGSTAWAQQGRVTIQASYSVSNPNR
jgi:methylmalonyl-CoA carboxyltransferase 12S subunit